MELETVMMRGFFFFYNRPLLRYTAHYMVITYYGTQFFKIQYGDLVIAYNPIKETQDKDSRIVRFGADIALVSINHPHFNGTENLLMGAKEPFVINGPGEYETKGIYIKGTYTRD